MNFTARVVNATIKQLVRIACRMDDAALSKIPQRGPLILMTNHINFLDVPAMVTHVLPRPVTGFAKIETWDNPVFNYLFNIWGGIPIKRGTVNLEAFRKALSALEEGKIFALAPEGTRSGNGHLQHGHAGIIPLAQRSGAPLMPLVFYGGEAIWGNLKRLHRTDFHIAVGRPFRLKTKERFISKEERLLIMDEVMFQLAALLPPQYRGVYSDLHKATQDHLKFLGGGEGGLGIED
jgi:1-acyl-sn-glycerol-3-phosphate acyltransferase